MHIVHFCPTPYLIPPKSYGGTERMVYWLARSQCLAHHTVTLIAHPDSKMHEEFPEIRFIPWDGLSQLESLLPDTTDVVHLHCVPRDFQGLKQPFLVTEHGNQPTHVQLHMNTVFVSESHARMHGRSTFVRNGVPVHDYFYSEDKQRMMLSLVRMEWPHKNVRTAIDLALDLNVPLSVCGKYSPWMQPKIWGDWCLRPLEVTRLVTRFGYVGGQRKLDLLSQAAVAFHAVNWHEPAGLVVLEALASGTPVLVTPNGACPEYVQPGNNGMVVSSYPEAVEAMQRLITLDAPQRREWARRCRSSAVTIESTAKGYLTMYVRVMAGEKLSLPDETRPLIARPVMQVTKPWLGMRSLPST